MSGQQSEIEVVSIIDPYLYQRLLSFRNMNVVINTTKNPLQGLLNSVSPDHVVIEVSNTPFYVRIQEIVWITLA
ncbi:YuzF family protein [Sporosarcina sp. FA9]|uniref:YuzF family protein n=1 Tax=Sporosarcina sp. FA9 TaxID=3413030 RepID=UPI003F655316